MQTVSFAPPEGFMDVDTSGPRERKGSTAESITSAVASSALHEVAANLANVKSAIRSGAADRNQVIDMLTNLLRETLQVNQSFCVPCMALQAHAISPGMCSECLAQVAYIYGCIFS
jgi:hypothetical protein